MSLLQVASMKEAQGEIKEIFQEIEATFGMLPAGVSLWSINPTALKYQWESIKEVFALDKDMQKMHAIIRYLVSERNQCKYCIGLNATMLINMFAISEEELQQLPNKLELARLGKKEQALLELAMASVENPKNVTLKDLDKLRNLGASEREMFDIVLAASQMLVVNTLFDTFDVE